MRKPQAFLEWIEANRGETREVGVRAVLTKKLDGMLVEERSGLRDTIFTRQLLPIAHQLFIQGFTPTEIDIEAEYDACLRATELTTIVDSRFDGGIPNYLALCYEMWNASGHLREMNPLQFTWYWVATQIRRVRDKVQNIIERWRYFHDRD